MNEELRELDEVTAGWEFVGDAMSNCDHQVDEAVRVLLVSAGLGSWGSYTAWNFFGRVWWDQERFRFRCLVQQYRVPVAVIEGETLQEIMDVASELFGGE